MTKVNKSFSKRLRVTPSGKLLGRKKRQNHFLSKRSGSQKQALKKPVLVSLTNKLKARFLPGKKTNKSNAYSI